MIRYLFLLLPVTFYGCINTDDYENIKRDFRNVDYVADNTNLDSIFEIIPAYNEINLAISSLHITFDRSILPDPQNYIKYLDSKDISIALGMYMADLGYARHFQKVHLCTEYLEAVKFLSEKLAIGSKEFDRIVPVIEKNIENQDMLLKITDSVIDMSNRFLTKNEQAGMSSLMIGGFWLESAYIGLSSETENKEEMKNAVDSHMNLLNDINYLFSCIDDGEILTGFKEDLLYLQHNTADADLYYEIKKIKNKYTK